MILFQLLIILIIVIIFYLLFSKANNIENYDARISGITRETCGKLCTETFGCLAFAYDDINAKCYLSKNPILFQPAASLYSTEYEVDHYRCNKTNPIRSDIDDIDDLDQEQLRQNMFYSCQNNEEDEYEFDKIANNEIYPINKTNTSGDTKPNTFENVEFEEYPVYKIKWPLYKKDLNPNELYNTEKNKLNNYTIFEKNTHQFDGEYLYPFKCVKDIPEDVCIRSCSNNDDCAGVEYNPLYKEKVHNNNNVNYKMTQNVCCPKKTITLMNERTKEFENGYFYIKRQPNELTKDNTYVIN